jgi:hypothetical protein
MDAPSDTAAGRIAASRGVMLAEVLIATAVLVAAGAAALQLTTTSMRGLWLAGVESAAVIAADQKLQQLRGLLWTIDAAGAPQSDLSSRLSIDPPDAGGTGLTPSPAGSLESNVDGFVDYLSEELSPLGSGLSPPPGAAYVRRWSIAPLAADPDHTLILRVLVIRVGPGAMSPRIPGQRGPGEAMLTTTLTRLAR